MKIINIIIGWFNKPKYIAVCADKNVKPEDVTKIIKSDQKLKGISFNSIPDSCWQISKDLDSLPRIVDDTDITIYKVTKNTVVQVDNSEYDSLKRKLKEVFDKRKGSDSSAPKTETSSSENNSNQVNNVKDSNIVDTGIANEGRPAGTTQKDVEEVNDTIISSIEKFQTEIESEIKSVRRELDQIRQAINSLEKIDWKKIQDQTESNAKEIEILRKDLVTKPQISDIASNAIQKKLQEGYLTRDKCQELVKSWLNNYLLKSDIDQVTSTIENMNKEINNLSDRLASLKTDNADQFGSMLSKIEKTKETVNEIVTVYQSSKAGKLRKEANQMKEEIENKNKELKEKEETLEKVNKEKESVKADNDKNLVEIEKFKKEIENKKLTIKQKQEELSNTQKTLQKTQEKLNTADQTIQNHEKTINDSNRKIKEQEEIIKKDEGVIEEKKLIIDERDKEIKNLRLEKDNLEEDLTSQKVTNEELIKRNAEDNKKYKDDFSRALESIQNVLSEGGYIIPCGDNDSDCEELESILKEKVEKFKNNISQKLNDCTEISVSINTLGECVDKELQSERSWIYDVARYKAYSSKRFMKDKSRDFGVRLDKNKITLIWENLNIILSMLNYSLIMPDLFEDSVSDSVEYVDNTGQTTSNLDFLIPNNDKYLVGICDNDGKIIRDYAEIGYKRNGELIKLTKVIR